MAKEKAPQTLDAPLFECFRAVCEGRAQLDQLRELLRRKVIAAMANGVATAELSIVLLAARHGMYSKAQEFLEQQGCLPLNASLLQGTGGFGVDFVICGWLPKGWAAEKLGRNRDLFQAYYRYEAKRHYRYKGRRFLETLPKVNLALADSEDTLHQFYEATSTDPKARIWICDPSTIPMRTFMGFIQMGEAPNTQTWIDLAQKHKVLEPIQDLFQVEWDSNDSAIEQWAFPDFFRKLSFVSVGQYQDVNEQQGNYSYTNSLSQINRWRDSVSIKELTSKVAVVELVSLIQSHEQYIEKVDIISRLSRYKAKANFAYASHDHNSDNDGQFDLPIPLWNTVILGTAGSRKTPLVAHVAQAFISADEPYDILYVNCKNSDKHTHYNEGPVETNEIWLFDDLVQQLSCVNTIPVRIPDLSRVLVQQPIDAQLGRSFYTELTNPNSTITDLQKQIPGKAERHGRNLLIIFDELLNHARKLSVDGTPLDPKPLEYLDIIKAELRSDGLRYLIIGQEIAHFYTQDAGQQSNKLQGLISECNVIMGCQAPHKENSEAYEQFLPGRRSRVESEPVWTYDFKKISELELPIGPFFLFAKDNTGHSHPVPGRVSQISAKSKMSETKYIWKVF